MIENRFRAWYASERTRPLVLAHRGDSFHAPENTLEAARLGFGSGADGWEFDVRLTSDGVAVLLHDPSLLGTTDVADQFEGDPRGSSGFLVGDFSLEEIRTLDAGSWFLDLLGGPRSAAGFGTQGRLDRAQRARYASGTMRVPTLAEALALTARSGALANVEIKPTAADPSRVLEVVLREIHDSGTHDLVAVSSFDLGFVSLVARACAGVAVGALVEEPPDAPVDQWLRELGADAIHAPASAVGPAMVGVPVLVYTVNDARPDGQAERLARGGVAGLFSDDPTSVVARLGVNRSSRHTRPHSDNAGRRAADW